MSVGEVIVSDGDDGTAGVFCAVTDPTGSWSSLRATILAPPFTGRDVSPHVTIVHPRTSDTGPQAWRELNGTAFDYSVLVRSFCLTATDLSAGMVVRRRFDLGD